MSGGGGVTDFKFLDIAAGERIPFFFQDNEVGRGDPAFGKHGFSIFLRPVVIPETRIFELSVRFAGEITEFRHFSGIFENQVIEAQLVAFFIFVSHVAEHQNPAGNFPLAVTDGGGAVGNMITLA